MVYQFLFLSFVSFFILSILSGKENKKIASIMGAVLLLLVALRDVTVGPDTRTYITSFITGYHNDSRALESLFLQWENFWRYLLDNNGQMYLIVCAVSSVGLVIFTIWKSSRQRVWSYTLFLTLFQWYFYLSGIRQGIAMGCFVYGTYLLSKNIDLLSFKTLRQLFTRDNIWGIFFLALAPLFHLTALFSIVLLFVLLLFRGNKWFYIIAISVTFLFCIFGTFTQMGQIMKEFFFIISSGFDEASRYDTYMTDERFLVDNTLYLVLKETVPMNGLAIIAAALYKKKYTIQDRLFFWMVIVYNLFYYFSYMFRLVMYFYPIACIAVVNMIYLSLKDSKSTNIKIITNILLIVFVILSAYVSYTNLTIGHDGAFSYKFCF